MSTNRNVKLEKVEKMERTKADNLELIYVDKMTSLAIGANVSRIGLGLEDPHKETIEEKYTLVIPTSSLFELVEVVQQSLKSPELKASLSSEIERLFK